MFLCVARRFGLTIQSLDAGSGCLYIAHMNADRIVVFDTASRKVLADLAGFPSVHGVWAVPELQRVFASATGDHEVAAVDTQTFRTVAKVGPINYPDGLAYAPGPERVFVSDEHGSTDAVIDTETYKLLKKIELGGGAGNTVFDPTANRILVAVHEKNELAAIDPVKLEIVGRYPLPGLREPHGISLDVANHLAFVAGAGNHTLAFIDLNTMQALGTYPVGDDPDVLSFDPGLKQLYISAESGDVWVYREKGRNLRMGLNTWAAFYGSNDNAAIAGDIAMLEKEVTPTLKALRSHGLDVVAIHQHMLSTHPTVIFLHYWGQGKVDDLATGFKAALDQLGH